MPDIADGDTVEVQGSAKAPYELKNVGGVYSCSCPAWRNQGGAIDKRTCKHLKAYRGEQAEIDRLGDAALVAKSSAPAGSSKSASSGASTSGGAPPVLLAHKWENDIDLVGWWMSEKLDGVRAWWDGTSFFSRLGNQFIAPAWFTKGLPSHPLDGELWVDRKEFQKCVSIVRSGGAGDQWKEVKYLVFDAPARDEAFEERLAYVHSLFGAAQHEFARPVEHVQCKGYDHLKTELARVEGLGGEGLMLRQPGSKYVDGRSTTLLKVKTFHDAEARVIGHEPGKGKHKGRLGALLCEMHDGTRFNVGTGFSDQERENPPAIGELVTYRYQELTKDGVPRFPSYVGPAIDKAGPTAPSAGKSTPVPMPLATGAALAKGPGAAPTAAPLASPLTAPVAAPTSQAAPVAATPSAASAPGAFRRFEMDEKFWAIALHGNAHTVKFGKLGTTGQEKTKVFADAATAKKEHDKLVDEKTGKGYVEVGAPVSAAPVSAAPVSAPQGDAHAVLKALSTGWRNKRWSDVESALHPQCVFVTAKGGRVEGRAACLQSYRDFMEKSRVLRVSESDHRLDVFGATAMASCKWEMTYIEGGRPTRAKGAETVALAFDGAWSVVWRRVDDTRASDDSDEGSAEGDADDSDEGSGEGDE